MHKELALPLNILALPKIYLLCRKLNILALPKIPCQVPAFARLLAKCSSSWPGVPSFSSAAFEFGRVSEYVKKKKQFEKRN
jgi:hypothetical protein